jgi:hypothetical protein
LVQNITVRIRPHHREWLEQQAANTSRSTVIRLLIQQAIDTATTPQQALINAR